MFALQGSLSIPHPTCAFHSAKRQQLRSVRFRPLFFAQKDINAHGLQWEISGAARSFGTVLLGAGAAALLYVGAPPPIAHAAGARLPPISESPERCLIEALDKFADTRATFSLEASGGNMTEAIVDIRDCSYTNLDLTEKVLSGVTMQGSDFSGSKMMGIQFARAQAQGASLRGVDLTDANCFGTSFDGADLEDAQFENAILSSASFGQYKGKWANLKGAHFEGALLSSSDVGRICENPTLDAFTKKAELGCRGVK